MIKPDFVTERVEETDTYGKFVLSPLPAGFGQTLGNSLRRTLLSSLEGAAVTYVKINDVVHPFSTIAGVKESVLDIILNIKLLRFKVTGRGPFTMKLAVKGKQKVKAGDFEGGDVKVVNGNQHIAQITGDRAKLEIELTIEKGFGYSPAEEKEKKEFGRLAVDSVFGPVVRANFSVEGARVGRKTTFDKLIFEVWTDGAISPGDAFRDGASLMASYFEYILSGRDVKKSREKESDELEVSPEVDEKVHQTIIDELDLPTRVVNALLRENIETVEDLLKRGKEDLVNLKGVGKKSLDLIDKELAKLGVVFEDDET